MMLNLYNLIELFHRFFDRSEQDKEPQQEAVSEVMGPGPTEESAANGKESTLEFLLSFSKWVERFNLFHIWRTTIY